MTTSRWALVGTGGIARLAISDLQMTDGLELVGVASRTHASAAAFAAAHDDLRAYESYEQLLADDNIDVVYIGTPIATHASLGEQALLSGKHVLIEKAFTADASEARRLSTRPDRHAHRRRK